MAICAVCFVRCCLVLCVSLLTYMHHLRNSESFSYCVFPTLIDMCVHMLLLPVVYSTTMYNIYIVQPL